MAISKNLFFLALCIWWGKCEVFYKKLGEEVSMYCGVGSNSDIEWKFNGELILDIRGKSGTKRKGSSHIKSKSIWRLSEGSRTGDKRRWNLLLQAVRETTHSACCVSLC